MPIANISSLRTWHGDFAGLGARHEKFEVVMAKLSVNWSTQDGLLTEQIG